MANSFFNFLTRFVSGTTVKAGPVNDRFTEVQSGFDNVETASKSSLKVTGYSSSSGIAATPDSFLMLNASGTPYASATLSFAPNFGGFKAQNLGDGVAASDAITYGQAQTLINTAAYGSPTVVSLPSLSGNALKTLRVNAGGVTPEWADALPITTGTGEVLCSVSGNPTWAGVGRNLLPYSNFEWGGTGWDLATNIIVDENQPIGKGTTGIVDIGTVASGVDAVKLADTHAISCQPSDAYTASVLFGCAFSAQNKVTLFLRFLDLSYAPVGSDFTVNVSALNDSTVRRYLVTATAPISSAYVVCGLKTSASITLGNKLFASQFQLEAGSSASPWSDVRSYKYVADYMAYVNHTADLDGYTASIGVGFADANIDFLSGNDATTATAQIKARNEVVGVGEGTLDVTCKKAIFSNVIGYAGLVVNGALGATPTIDFMAGAKQSGSLSANAVITLTAPPSDIVFEAKLYLKQDATGSRTATFASAATIKHVGGSAKAPQTAANSETCYNVTWDGARFIISGYDL